MDAYTFIGLVGVTSYVASYALLQLGMIDGNGVRYSVMNVVAAMLVLLSLTKDFNLASALTQIVWIAIGIAGLASRARRHLAPASTSVSPLRDETYATGDAPAGVSSLGLVTQDTAHVNPARGATRLVPDSARPTGRPTVGLRADVLAAYRSAGANTSSS